MPPPQIHHLHASSRRRAPKHVTLVPGDGIGPLVTSAVVQVMEAMHAPVIFEKFDVYGDMKSFPEEVMESIKKNKVCLKGGLATPMGGCVSSLNFQLRKEIDLCASLVNCFNLPGLPTRHENVDIVVIRENTEGEYAGLEHEVVPGVVESLKVFHSSCFIPFSSFLLSFEFHCFTFVRKKKTSLLNIHPLVMSSALKVDVEIYQPATLFSSSHIGRD
uniref:Isopropylmalate dehydrogenase-like domain-containing protein n=1 Tax=Kalanchoe fedtschenkoi TaxID=63787 RepID=A0A7N1A0L7_KALFE